MVDPFQDSNSLANWAADTLRVRGVDEIAKWRMVEYWFQVELYRAVEAGQAGDWRYVGSYEHPYQTEFPRSGSKTKTKWIDLVLAAPDIRAPNRVVWIELKDLGRSESTALKNAKGLGHDLAALWACDPVATRELWLNPAPHSLDRGRADEWTALGPGINCSDQLLAQVVLSHKSLNRVAPPDKVSELWCSAFLSRCGSAADNTNFDIAQAETEMFTVLTLVGRVGQGSELTANNHMETDA